MSLEVSSQYSTLMHEISRDIIKSTLTKADLHFDLTA